MCMYVFSMITLMFVVVVNGGYSPWSDWTQCTVTCGGGESLRSRQCTNPAPEFGGKDCSSLGSSSETMKCKSDPCPGKSSQSQYQNSSHLHVLQITQLNLVVTQTSCVDFPWFSDIQAMFTCSN